MSTFKFPGLNRRGLVVAMLCLGLSAVGHSATPVGAPANAPFTQAQIQQALRQVEKQKNAAFAKQAARDSLIKVTDNSFLSPDFHPVPGGAVLLVVGVRRWENTGSGPEGMIYLPQYRSHIHFEVVCGDARLLSLTALTPGQVPVDTARSLEVVADSQDCASVWLCLANGSSGPVEVRATFAHTGKRIAFEDPGQAVTFDVDPDGAHKGYTAGLDDDLRAHFANRRMADRAVLEITNEKLDPTHPGRSPRVIAKIRSVKVDGKAYLSSQAGKSAMAKGPAEGDLEKWELSLPKAVTHQAKGGRFAVVKQLAGGYVVDAYDKSQVALGPFTSIILCDAQGTVMDDRTDYSQPFASHGYQRWGREDERVALRVTSGQGPQERVRKVQSLDNGAKDWKSALEGGR